MSLAQAPAATEHLAPSALATKVAAVAAALLAVSLFMTVAVINVPHDPSDQELLTWWQDSGNRGAGVLSGVWALRFLSDIAAETPMTVVTCASMKKKKNFQNRRPTRYSSISW